MALRSQQLGHYESREDERLAAAILRRAAFITTRDCAQSSHEARRIWPDAVVREQVDDAFFVDIDSRSHVDVLAAHRLEPGAYICVGYRYNPRVGVDESTDVRFAQAVDLVCRRSGLMAVLMPQGPSDVRALERLQTHCRVPSRLLTFNDWFREPIAIAAHAHSAVALPHHTLIFALRGGVPILSPVVGAYYRFKNVGSMRLFGLSEFVIDMEKSADSYRALVESRSRELVDRHRAHCSRIRSLVTELRTAAAANEREFGRVLYLAAAAKFMRRLS